jgi:hypothetical protein
MLLMRRGCINEKNVKARRGNMATVKGPNIVRAMIQTKVCLAGYFLPAKNVSGEKKEEEEEEEEERSEIYDLSNACQT